jgi:hypothetical protein
VAGTKTPLWWGVIVPAKLMTVGSQWAMRVAESPVASSSQVRNDVAFRQQKTFVSLRELRLAMNPRAKMNWLLLSFSLILVAANEIVPAATKESANKAGRPHAMNLEKSLFGKMPDGSTVDLYTLRNRHGTVVKIISYGAIITEIHTLDRNISL